MLLRRRYWFRPMGISAETPLRQGIQRFASEMTVSLICQGVQAIHPIRRNQYRAVGSF